MWQRFEPGVLRLFLVTTFSLFFLPIFVYFVSAGKDQIEITKDWQKHQQIIANGLSAVATVNVVIAGFMIVVYKKDIDKKVQVSLGLHLLSWHEELVSIVIIVWLWWF